MRRASLVFAAALVALAPRAARAQDATDDAGEKEPAPAPAAAPPAAAPPPPPEPPRPPAPPLSPALTIAGAQVSPPPNPGAAGDGLSAPGLSPLVIHGYVIPTLLAAHRSDAVARDKLTLGVASTRFGVVFAGEPFEMWRYRVEATFDAAMLSNRDAAARAVVTDVGIVDTTGTGSSTPGTAVTHTFITDVNIQEATVSFQPIDWFYATLGHMRMPFSVAQGAVLTAQMFPRRPAPSNLFTSGADDGLVGTFDLLERRMQIRVGAFNGSSLGLQVPQTTPLGPVYSAFVDVQPLGTLPPREGDSGRGPLRIGLGMGALYRNGALFDAKGFEATRFRDVRLSAAVRLAFRGLFLQGEYLRRVQTDNLSLRPSLATGAYVQASYYYRIDRIALGPIGRFGVSVEDENFAGQRTTSYEGGIAFYPRADVPQPDALRLILQYAGERRSPSEETANAGIFSLQIRW